MLLKVLNSTFYRVGRPTMTVCCHWQRCGHTDPAGTRVGVKGRVSACHWVLCSSDAWSYLWCQRSSEMLGQSKLLFQFLLSRPCAWFILLAFLLIFCQIINMVGKHVFSFYSTLQHFKKILMFNCTKNLFLLLNCHCCCHYHAVTCKSSTSVC